MQFNIKPGENHRSAILRLSLLTALGALLCTLFGYFALPFAAASYASLIAFENRGKRVFSYIVPVIMFFVNFLFMGFYSLEGIAYVVVGIIIYLLAKLGKSKGEVAFWCSAVLLVLMFVSAILFAMDYNNSLSLWRAFDFYGDLIATAREKLTDAMLKVKNDNSSFAYTAADADAMFDSLLLGIVPTALILAFLLSGITLKFFTKNLFRYSEEEPHPFNWCFRTTNFIAYFYIVVLIFFGIVPEDSGVLDLLVSTLYSLFSLVFAYLGVKFLFAFFIAKGKRPILALLIIIAIFVVFSSFVLTAASLLGVYVNNSMNKLSGLIDKNGKKQ